MPTENTNSNKKKMSRRELFMYSGIIAGASLATGGATYYFTDQQSKSSGEQFNAPNETTIAKIQEENAAKATGIPSPATPTKEATQEPEISTTMTPTPEPEGVENLPEDTTPSIGEQPKNIDWNTINPMTLRIPDVGFNAGLTYTGDTYNAQTGYSEINVPVTYRIGVYTDSAPLTSATGTTLLVGHVNWSNGAAAPMSAITACKVGNTVYTTDHNGTLTEWAVTGIEPKIPQPDLSKRWNVTAKTGKRQLLMATCRGTYQNGRWTYHDNFVVIAEPKNK